MTACGSPSNGSIDTREVRSQNQSAKKPEISPPLARAIAVVFVRGNELKGALRSSFGFAHRRKAAQCGCLGFVRLRTRAAGGRSAICSKRPAAVSRKARANGGQGHRDTMRVFHVLTIRVPGLLDRGRSLSQ